MAVFTVKVAADLDPQKPITTTKMNNLWDNTTYAKDLLASHTHDGVTSAAIPTGANAIKNGSFEDLTGGLNGWSGTIFTGGTAVVQQAEAMHGKFCLAITSTVIANGGAEYVNDEFFPVAAGGVYSASAMFKGSVADISSRIEIIWYDSAQNQISTSTQTTTSTPTTKTWLGSAQTAPATAAYARVKIYGGVPTVGTTFGTIYVDGVVFASQDNISPAVTIGTNPQYLYTASATFAGTDLDGNEILNVRIKQSGYIRTKMVATGFGTAQQIYKNGIAHSDSVLHIYPGTFYDDLYFNANDTLQVIATYNSGITVDLSIGFDSKSFMFLPISATIGER